MNAIINWVGALGVARQCVLAVGLLAAIACAGSVQAQRVGRAAQHLPPPPVRRGHRAQRRDSFHRL